MKITRELLKEWRACWNPDQYDAVESRLGKTPTVRAVCTDAKISLDDRLWVVAHALWKADPDHAALWAVECAESVTKHAGDARDQEQYAPLMGELRTIILTTPRGSDLREAKLAEWRSAWAAARAAAWDAAWDAALRKQIDRALEMLGGEADS